MSTWHEVFSRWAKPASDFEEQKAERAARMVREALHSDGALSAVNFDVIALGSYRNNTNVKASSDIDLAAVLRSAQYSEFPADGSLNAQKVGLGSGPVTYELVQFRQDLNRAPRDRFGSGDVAHGRISITVDETNARLGVDVTPFLIHRRYTGTRLTNGQWQTLDGIESRPVDAPSRRLIQWPEQHYAEGVAKNNATNRRYKRLVRIIKCMRAELEGGAPTTSEMARKVKSCFIEHAVFNVPNSAFNLSEGTYLEDVKAVLKDLWNAARTPARVSAMTEVNRLLPLFRDSEPWSPKLLEDFSLACWQRAGFA